MKLLRPLLLLVLAPVRPASAAPVIEIATPLAAPEWARLERRLLDEQVPACREFHAKYYDARGYLQCFVRWGANDGPDDAFENFNHWPELHALGAADEVMDIYLRAWEGMLRQYAEARTVEVPAARQGMYQRDFCVQSDWMHHGEGLQNFNRMGLSVPELPIYQERARRFAGFYLGTDPAAPNYDPERRLIRSLLNGSGGPMLRPATALDWAGDPFDAKGFVALHGESTYAQFLEHYREYTDVVGDGFLNLVATTLPTNAYLLDGDARYRRWLTAYLDAWLARMRANGGIIPSFVDLNGKVGGPEGRWWGNVYGWGFSPVNPVTGHRENRNRIPRALVGFHNALLVTGDQKYPDAWRTMRDAINAQAREDNGRRLYPTMHGAEGWYGWQPRPWSVGALELWSWSMRDDDRAWVADQPWLRFLAGNAPDFPLETLRRDLATVARKRELIRQDRSDPAKRLADNLLDLNPATTSGLVMLMLGGVPPGRDGGLLNARLRYFDPAHRRAGLPPDVGALVTRLTGTETTVTLVNLHPSEAREVVVQGGAYGEHPVTTVVAPDDTAHRVGGPSFSVRLGPAAGGTLTLGHRRYAGTPSIRFPWNRTP